MKITIDTEKIKELRTIKSLALVYAASDMSDYSKTDEEIANELWSMISFAEQAIINSSQTKNRMQALRELFSDEIIDEIVSHIRSEQKEAKAIAKYVIERNK